MPAARLHPNQLTQGDIAVARKGLLRDYYDVSGWQVPKGFGSLSARFGPVAVNMMRRVNKKELPGRDPDVWTKQLTKKIHQALQVDLTPLQIARPFIGPIEIGNNSGPLVVKVQLATDLPPGKWPYCAAGVSFCLSESDWKYWLEFKKNEPEAWVPGWVDAARAHKYGMTVLPNHMAAPNDLICFDWAGTGGNSANFDHIGLVRTKVVNSVVGTREFNTGPGAGGNQSDGDGCWDRFRPVNDGVLIIRGGWQH